MTSPPDLTTYPRPDFFRRNLRWESLNGPWDFLFDDEDVGLDAGWHLHGLPASVTLSTNAGHDDGNLEFDEVGDRITQSIVSGTQERLSQNTLNKTSGSSENTKRTIQVPFVFQSPASGINERGVHEVLWYEREIKDPRDSHDRDCRDTVLLRFGAVDYLATVWVDGRFCGQHRGGHVPFDIDITDALNCAPGQIAHRVTVRVYDSAYDLTQPRGKQYWGAKPESIFYTPSGGIWQSVWAEVVPRARIADSSQGTVLRSNDIKEGILHATVGVLGRKAGEKLDVELKSWYKGQLVSSVRKALSKETSSVELDLDMKFPGSSVEKDQESSGEASGKWKGSMLVWSPENPLLYDLSIRLYSSNGDLVDLAETYVGMRSIEWTDGTWKLNGRPYFQALVLDQGYWPETFMTPPSADALRQDIALAKRMGFNGCRKHQKVEAPAFYHWADKLGFLVWGEMASTYKFSGESVARFTQEWTEAVKLVINHPSVVTWTPVNESWGYPALHDNVQQRNHIRALYYLTKSLDPTRPINDNCGWQHVQTDLTTFHDYSDGPALARTCADLRLILAKKADRDVFVGKLPGQQDPGAEHTAAKPVMCTEFGGVNIAAAAAEGVHDRDWGYTTAQSPEDLLKRIERLVRGVVEGGHCCAFVYTQL